MARRGRGSLARTIHEDFAPRRSFGPIAAPSPLRMLFKHALRVWSCSRAEILGEDSLSLVESAPRRREAKVLPAIHADERKAPANSPGWQRAAIQPCVFEARTTARCVIAARRCGE